MGGVVAVVMALQTALPLTPVAQGASSQIMELRQVVAKTAGAWQALWKEHSAAPMPVSEIDFSQFMIVGVFLGTRPTAGFSVEITTVTVRDGAVVVEYVERRPDPGGVTAQVLTSPFHIVRVPRAAGIVKFQALPRP